MQKTSPTLSGLAKCLIASLILGFGTASCGLKGELATPAPLFGDPTRAAPDNRRLPEQEIETDEELFDADESTDNAPDSEDNAAEQT